MTVPNDKQKELAEYLATYVAMPLFEPTGPSRVDLIAQALADAAGPDPVKDFVSRSAHLQAIADAEARGRVAGLREAADEAYIDSRDAILALIPKEEVVT
jgi:hypothetical protein